jgi:hypothetical protein
MTDIVNTDEKLANQFASFSPEALKKTFAELDADLRSKARVVAEDLSSIKKRLDDLLPLLDEMQSFLSQRGTARDKFQDAGLPTWSAWLKAFKAEVGLNVTLRAVQKQLSKLRGTKRKKPDPPVNLSQRDQRRLLSAQQFANEMVKAIDCGADPSVPLADYKRVAMDSDKITALFDGLTCNEVAESIASSGAPIDLAEVPRAVVQPQPKDSAETVQTDESLPLPRAGAWVDLASNVQLLCAEHFSAALGGLDADVMADVFAKFAQRLAQSVCRCPSGSALDLKIKVEFAKNSLQPYRVIKTA